MSNHSKNRLDFVISNIKSNYNNNPNLPPPPAEPKNDDEKVAKLEEELDLLNEEVDENKFPKKLRPTISRMKIETRLKHLSDIRFFDDEDAETTVSKFLEKMKAKHSIERDENYDRKAEREKPLDPKHYQMLKQANRSELKTTYEFDYFKYMDNCYNKIIKQRNRDRKNTKSM